MAAQVQAFIIPGNRPVVMKGHATGPDEQVHKEREQDRWLINHSPNLRNPIAARNRHLASLVCSREDDGLGTMSCKSSEVCRELQGLDGASWSRWKKRCEVPTQPGAEAPRELPGCQRIEIKMLGSWTDAVVLAGSGRSLLALSVLSSLQTKLGEGGEGGNAIHLGNTVHWPAKLLQGPHQRIEWTEHVHRNTLSCKQGGETGTAVGCGVAHLCPQTGRDRQVES